MIILFSRNGNVAELKRLMEWKHIAREAITAGPQTQQSNQTHGVE